MRRFCSILVLAAVLQVVFGKHNFRSEPFIPREPREIGLYHPYQERIPRHCWAPPRQINPFKCCPIPRFYSDEVLNLCGIEKHPDDVDDSNFPVVHKDPRKVPCKEGTCLMANANLLKSNRSVDYEKLRSYIDNWANANPEFTEAIMAAKKICAKEPNPGPPVCEPDRIFLCMKANILWNCNFKEIDDCPILKQHIDECKPYYMKPKDPRINQKEEKKN